MWHSLSDSVKSIATLWGFALPPNERPSARIPVEPSYKKAKTESGEAKATRMVYSAHVNPPTPETNQVEPELAQHHPLGGRRQKRTQSHISTDQPQDQANHTSVGHLITTMDNLLKIGHSSPGLRESNLQLRRSIQQIQLDMQSAERESKPEIQTLMKLLEQRDPGHPTIHMTHIMLAKIAVLVHDRSYLRTTTWGHRGGQKKRLTDVELHRCLEKSRWNMEQRAINVRYMLQNLISTLEPLIFESPESDATNQEPEEDFVVVDKPRYHARDEMLNMDANRRLDGPRMTLFSFFSVSELGSTLSTTCSSWTTYIQEHQLVHSGQKNRQERWKCWTHAIERRKLHQVPPSYAALLIQAQREEQEASRCGDSSSSVSKNRSSVMDYALLQRDICRTTFASPEDIYAPSGSSFERHVSTKDDHHRVTSNNQREDHYHSYQGMLKRILLTYGVYDRATGYCQGMTFIASVILSCMDFEEEKSFYLFAALLDRYELSQMFVEGLSGTLMRSYQLERLMQLNLPDLMTQFNRQNIQPLMFSTGWVMTLFQSDMKMHPSIAARILDQFFINDWVGHFKFMLGILHFSQPKLLGKSMNQTLQYLSQIGTTCLTLDQYQKVVASSSWTCPKGCTATNLITLQQAHEHQTRSTGRRKSNFWTS